MKASSWMHLYGPPRAGIRFNNQTFTEPAPLPLVAPPVSSGIYVVLALDVSCRPRSFRAIYFGESRNFHEDVTQTHEHYGDWIKEAGGVANTFVAFCPTPLLKEVQRRWVENDLIVRYRPVCNLKDNQIPSSYQPLLGIAK
ncbi:MAG: hypothetical protein EPN47_16950 [Acidobacteria bacterium]|nr:MAG: hypothetical protein EPN47_16950 [Acidobacteriota bacterium]